VMPHCNNPSKFSFLCQYMGNSLDLFWSFLNHWMPLLVHFVKWTGYMFQQTASYHFNIWNKIISIAININLGAQINCFHKWFHEVGNWVVFQSGLHPQEGSIMSRNISTKACRYCQIHETSVRKLIYVVKFMIGMYGIPHHCSYVHIYVFKIMMSSCGLGTCYLECRSATRLRFMVWYSLQERQRVVKISQACSTQIRQSWWIHQAIRQQYVANAECCTTMVSKLSQNLELWISVHI
jgi:hypothetical protein